MANDAYLYLLLMAEELMVMHLARYEGVAARADGVAEEKRARASAEAYGLYAAAEKLVGLKAFHVEDLLQSQYEVVGGQGFSE